MLGTLIAFPRMNPSADQPQASLLPSLWVVLMWALLFSRSPSVWECSKLSESLEPSSCLRSLSSTSQTTYGQEKCQHQLFLWCSVREVLGFALNRVLKRKLILLFCIILVHVNPTSEDLKSSIICTILSQSYRYSSTKSKLNSQGKDKEQFKVNYS